MVFMSALHVAQPVIGYAPSPALPPASCAPLERQGRPKLDTAPTCDNSFPAPLAREQLQRGDTQLRDAAFAPRARL